MGENLHTNPSTVAPADDPESSLRNRRKLMAGGAAALAATAAGVMASQSPAGAQTTTPVLVPITPFRIYDSRQGGGRLSSGEFDVLTSGPAEAFAFLMNVTVTATAASGYLALFEAGETWGGTSSINWYTSGMTIANNAYVALRQSDSGITVLCGGGGSTQYVLDVMGVLIDPAALGGAAVAGQRTAQNDLARLAGSFSARRFTEG